MKNFSRLLFFMLCAGCISSDLAAQKTVNEATLTYQISIENPDGSPVGKATLQLFVKGPQSRTTMTSNMGTESAFFDNKQGKGAILKEYSGQKLMITMNQVNWNQKNKMFREMSFSSAGKTEQSIGNFTCQSASGTTSDGKKITVCYMPETVLVNNQYNNAFTQLAGIPVQYQTESGKLIFRYTLSTVSYDPVPASTFDLPKTGYRMMTYEENQQLKKG